MTADTLSVLHHSTNAIAKTWLADGSIKPYDDPKFFTLESVVVDGIETLSVLLHRLENKRSCLIRGTYVGDDLAKQRDPEYKPGRVRRTLDCFSDQPLHTLLVEVDTFESLAFDPLVSPEDAINEYVHLCLPAVFHSVSYHWQLSNSAGHPKHAGKLKAHLWFWLETPYRSAQLRAWATAEGLALDRSVLNPVQIHYTSVPLFENGVVDPVLRRSGLVIGLAGDAVGLVLGGDALQATGSGDGSEGGRGARLRELVDADPIAQKLVGLGLVLSQGRSGELNLECPFADQHTGASGETSTRYWPPNTGGFAKGNFKCLHAHCADRGRNVWLARLGVFEDLDADAFAVVIGERADGGTSGGVNSDPLDTPPEIKGIPEAKHLCTDQANANRLVKRFGKRLFVAAGRWYSWDSRRWVPDEGDVYRYTCQLSRIVHAEASAWRAKTTADLAQATKNKAVAEALDKWAIKCEMKGSIEATIGLARKMLTVEDGALDRNPWLLNVRNGTVDLRTGELREHRASDYITKLACADLDFNAKAVAPLWSSVLAQITLETERVTRPVASFLQRWFGYCATGMTREQQFVVHYGSGSNGKSTILDMVTDVLGDYAGTAAPGLLMNGGRDRHPTEIADLFGRRMMTAHEAGEGGVLREDFVKQATGGDRLKGRFMQADFFEFPPTHKLQLLTNHKPVIKGQDVGIWRRVVLMPYMARFGGREEVNAGLAHYVKDVGLSERLVAEREGVLAWIVQGAITWAQDGLQPPDSVLAASRDYQTEQDRVGQFVSECCAVGGAFSEPLVLGMGGGLYPAYVGWCKEGGTLPLAKNRFLLEALRAVTGSKTSVGKMQDVDFNRRNVVKVHGLKLLECG